MQTAQITSPETPEQVIRRIMTLCPGGPVGVVLRKEGRLLLPRLMTITRVVIDRRGHRAPPGRIVVLLAPAERGTAVTITSAVHPSGPIVLLTFVAALAYGVWRFAGGGASLAAVALVTPLLAMWWRKGAAAAAADAGWLARELASAPSRVTG